MKTETIKIITHKLLLGLVLFICALNVGAEVIRVNGVVLDGKDRPVYGVFVKVEGEKIPPFQTDEDGKFVLTCMDDARLTFHMVGFEPQTVRVKGKTDLTVHMVAKDLTLGPAVVRAKRIVKEVKPEQTVIEVHGNYLTITDPIRIPKELFYGKSRMVVQPVLNDLTAGTTTFMPPYVFDGLEYNKTQERMYGYELKRDSLMPYIRLNNQDSTVYRSPKGEKLGYVIMYKDSSYVANGKHDFSCDMEYALEDYLHIYYGDTITVAKGTVNPLRFMDYHFASSVVTDTNYLPKLEVQLREGEGKINLRFPAGVSTLDVNDSINGAEIRRLQYQLRDADSGKGQSLKDFKIHGLSSPEGSYEKNLALSKERMKYSLDLILSNLSEATRKKMKVASDSRVAKWDDVAALMLKDSLKKEAQAVMDVAKRYRNSERQLNTAMRELPFFSTLLMPKYLPMLRTSNYSFSYNLYRQLTMDEIKELYAQDYKKLSRYEFWKLYSAEKDETKREKYITQALDVYPRFMVAANDLAAIRITHNQSDPNILQHFAGPKAPSEVNMNQSIALLDAGRYYEADTIMEFVPKNEKTKMLHAVIGIFNRQFAENYDIIAATGVKNEVLMLLAMKKNEAALAKSMQLPDSVALSHYLRATCYNRLEKVNEAIDELNLAFKKDPNLKKVAKVDGDINKLLPPEDELKPKAQK